MRDFKTINVEEFATKMIPVLRPRVQLEFAYFPDRCCAQHLNPHRLRIEWTSMMTSS